MAIVVENDCFVQFVKTQFIASLRETTLIRSCLSLRMRRDAIYCVLESKEHLTSD